MSSIVCVPERVISPVVATFTEFFTSKPLATLSTYALTLCWEGTAVALLDEKLSSSLKSITVAVPEPSNIGILLAALVNPAKATNSVSKLIVPLVDRDKPVEAAKHIVPEALGILIVWSCVGSVTAIVVSKSLAVAPSSVIGWAPSILILLV